MESSQVAMADTGTDTTTGTPKSAMPLAMPANSESVTARLDTMSASMATAEMRMPKRSRMSEANPLPVAHPMRAAVSCTTTSSTPITGTVQSMPKPNWAPAVE